MIRVTPGNMRPIAARISATPNTMSRPAERATASTTRRVVAPSAHQRDGHEQDGLAAHVSTSGIAGSWPGNATLSGNAALGVYDDGAAQLAVADQFRALLASRDPLPTPVPDLLAYLDGYPNRRPPGAEDLFYWTVVEFGLKPTIRVNRVVIQPLEANASSGVAYVIAIKQLYASHYFHTTLELRFLIDDERPGRDGSWLISVTRSRSDGLTGVTGLFVRPVVNSRSRDAVRKYLEHVKRQIASPER